MEHLEAPFYKAVQKEEDRRRKTKEEHVKKTKKKRNLSENSSPVVQTNLEGLYI